MIVNYYYREINLKEYLVDYQNSLNIAFFDLLNTTNHIILYVYKLDDLDKPFLTSLFGEKNLRNLKKNKKINLMIEKRCFLLSFITERDYSNIPEESGVLACFIDGNFLSKNFIKISHVKMINWVPWIPKDIVDAKKTLNLIKKI